LTILAILGLKICSLLLRRSGISCQTTSNATPNDEIEVDY